MIERLPPEARLALSRERLRFAMRSQPKRNVSPTNTAALDWLETLKSEPGTRIVLEAVRHWWEQHPLRTVGSMVTQSIRTALTPLAQRNPLGLVLVAFVAGGLLTLAKPWRWISLPAIFTLVLPQVLIKLKSQNPPVTWLDGLAALLRPESEFKK